MLILSLIIDEMELNLYHHTHKIIISELRKYNKQRKLKCAEIA